MFVVYKNCNLACCCQRRYRGFSTRLLHRSNPCRLENVPQSCSMLMDLWTCLKGEKVMMCWFSAIYLDAHSQHAYLHLCLCPSLSKSKRSWALWTEQPGCTCPHVLGGPSPPTPGCFTAQTSLPCACTSLRMLVWPMHFQFPVTSQKHFCLCIVNIALMVCSAALDYIPSG